MANTTTNGFQGSRLADLPPELRNRIWGYVFAGLEEKLVMPLLRYVRFARWSQPTHRNCAELALLRTCKQVHCEASGIAWSRIAAYDTRLRRYRSTTRRAIKYGPEIMSISRGLTTVLATKLKFIQELILTDKVTLKWMEGRGGEAVSYTHLTLPTKRIV